MITLRPEQEEAVEKLRNGSILCGGVGSGKSITSIYYYFYKICKGKILRGKPIMESPKDLYIITTARKRDTLEWEGELSSFLLSSIEENEQVSIIVDSWNNIKKYADVKNAFFIFDEQRVVGYGTWVKNFLKITKVNQWILLSATPGDTWTDYIPVFIANGFYKNKSDFTRHHVVYSPYTKFPKVEKYLDQGHLIKLRNYILVDMDSQRETVRHNFQKICLYDKDDYKMVMKDRWNIYEDKPIKNISSLCYLLRKVCNSDPSRIEAVREIMCQHAKAIIFYNFDYELEMLIEFAKKYNTPYAQWNGHKHELIPKTKRWIYLVQYTAGAEGWNCIETDTIVFYSQNYSYKILEQASGRIDRINTPFKDLYYYHLRSTSNIDLAINKAIKKKKNFNQRKFIGD